MKRKVTGFSESGSPIYDDEVVEEYQNLAAAIVRAANHDYIKIYEGLLTAKSKSKLQDLQREKARLEDFYFSDWYDDLCGIDPQILVMYLQKRATDNVKKRIKRKHDKE